MRYAVIICPHCTTPKIIEQKHKTTSCISCGKHLIIKKTKIQYKTDSIEKARQIIGQINAEQDGQLDHFKTILRNK